jgi:hypothetical protein
MLVGEVAWSTKNLMYAETIVFPKGIEDRSHFTKLRK